MSFIRAAIALVLVAALAGPAGATAKTVTLLGVSGVDGAKFSKALEGELGELYELVPGSRYRQKAQELGKPGASPAEVAAVATAIGADAIIGGAVAGKGRNRQLLIAVREGATGRVIARARYGLGGRSLPVVRERVAADLVRALERVHPIGSRPAAQAQAQAQEENETPSQTNVEAPAQLPPPPVTEDVAPTIAEEKTVAPRRAHAGVEAGVGPSLLSRTLSFDVPSAPGYSGGVVGGIRAAGTVYPLSLSYELAAEHPVLASFGFSGSYEYVFTFTSTANGGSSRGSASRWNVRLVGRAPLGHGARGGFLTIDTGLQQMSWSHASPVDVGVPNVRYDLVGGGLGWERALGTRWLIVSVRLGADGLLSAGDIGGDLEYGSVGGWGLDVAGSVAARPRDWLWIKISTDWERIAMSFAGTGQRFARSASDSWVGAALEVGFAL